MAPEWIMRGSAGLLVMLLAGCGGTPEQGIARGKDLFDTCVPCHGADGAGNQVLGAPVIAGLPTWYIEAQLKSFQDGHRGYAPFDTVGIRMKTMSWSLDLDGDNGSVAAYVASMAKPAPGAHTVTGDVAAGQVAFALCASCHGADGSGSEVLHGPPLKGQSDWYLLAQLRKFRKGDRGTRAGDVWGGAMRPNALALDDAAMANVIAYIQTLK
jgi:cytochrome c oxidase subunit 2